MPWKMGMLTGSLGPKMDTERREQVRKSVVFAARTRFSAAV
jgi:hypothetical protein